MDIIQFLFQLVWKHVPMNEQDFAKIKAEGEDWYRSIVWKDVEKPTLLQTVKMHADKWYSKLGLAISFIFADRALYDYRNRLNEPDPEDEDLHAQRYVQPVY